MIQGVVKRRDFIARSKDCLPTRLHLLEIYHGSQHSKEDNEGGFSSTRARARACDRTNRYKSRAPYRLRPPTGDLNGAEIYGRRKVRRAPVSQSDTTTERREVSPYLPVIRYSVSVRVIHFYPLYVYDVVFPWAPYLNGDNATRILNRQDSKCVVNGYRIW